MKQMMKLSSVTLIAALVCFNASAFAAGEKMASVNVAKILNGYTKTKDNERILQEAGRKKEQERDAMVQSVRQMKDELALLAEDAKTKKQEDLDRKIKELQDFDMLAKQDLGKQRDTMLREILTDIDSTVKRYGERKGLDLVLSENALVYYNPKLEVTQEILEELNKGYKKK